MKRPTTQQGLVKQQSSLFGLWHQPPEQPSLFPLPEVAPSGSHRAYIANAMAVAVAALLRLHPTVPRLELRERIRIALAAAGTTPPAAFDAWNAWLSGAPCNQRAAGAWYNAITSAAGLVKAPRFPSH